MISWKIFGKTCTLIGIFLMTCPPVLAGIKAKPPAPDDAKYNENCGRDGFWFSDKLLHEAMQSGDEKMAQCAAKKDPILTTPTWDRNIPHLLYNYRNEKITEIIIQFVPAKRLNENSIMGNAFTVIYNTYRENMKASWVKALVKKGVDPDISTAATKSAREMACVYGNDEIVKALPPKDTGKNLKPGTTVWIRGEREAKLVRSCKTGAVVMLAGKQDYFGNADIHEVSDSAKASQGKKAVVAKSTMTEEDKRYAENYERNKNRLNGLKAQMARKAAQIEQVENEMSSIGWSGPSAAPTGVTGYQCDVNNQNCRARYQGGGESGSSYWRRSTNMQKQRDLDRKRNILILEYDSLAHKYNEIIEGKKK